MTGRLGIEKETFGGSSINNITSQYNQQLEWYGAHHLIGGPVVPTPQPQVHIGMLATPQLNPSTEATTFLNSVCYWLIEAELDVSINHSSSFTKGQLSVYPTEVMFYPNKNKKYTDGTTLLGMNDGDLGNTFDEDDEEESLSSPCGTTSNFRISSTENTAKKFSNLSVTFKNK